MVGWCCTVDTMSSPTTAGARLRGGVSTPHWKGRCQVRRSRLNIQDKLSYLDIVLSIKGRFTVLTLFRTLLPRKQMCLESCMWCSQACVDTICSTTCRSESAGDERLLCRFRVLRVGHSCTETFPDVPISCVCHELQMDRKYEVSRCAMCGLTHAGPKEGMNVKILRGWKT